MKIEFRTLEPDEIEIRVSKVQGNGVSLLLYKNARVDQQLLDEIVGPLGWQRRHPNGNENCIVSIWDSDKQQWIEKEDTGSESASQAKKGLASDSFKRACVNWGIGRELYSAPFIWVTSDNARIEADTKKEGKFVCRSTFSVREIEYDSKRKISKLVIINDKTGKDVYRWENGKAIEIPKEQGQLKPVCENEPSVDKKEDTADKNAGKAASSSVSTRKPSTEKASKAVPEANKSSAQEAKAETASKTAPEVSKPTEQKKKAETEPKPVTITLEEALKMPAEIGAAQARGWTLKDTLEKKPLNIRWMYAQPGISDTFKEALRVVALSDDTVKTSFAEFGLVL